MKDKYTKEDMGGNAIGVNSQPIYCVECSPKPLDYMTAVFFKVVDMGIKQPEATYKPNLDIAMCPVCSKLIAY